MIADRVDDTNFTRLYDSTSPVRGVLLFPYDIRESVSTRRDKVDVSRLAILATVSNGSLCQRGRNSQSRRGEQKAAEKAELGDHGEDDGDVNRGYN